MITKLVSLIFGTKNARELKRMRPIVQRINDLEAATSSLQDAELMMKTSEFKERSAKKEPLDSILPEAFAVAREATNRTLGTRHYDEQLIGGIVLHEGKIAEMKTGEGKTQVAVLPLYLNALSGLGAHLITVNDYLAKRDAEWMGPIYNALGINVGVIQNNMDDGARKEAYGADVTYGTNNEFGFDYLRDNMKFSLDDYVQRKLNFSIVDEVDSILIDEARTPLIISGPAERGSNLYVIADKAVKRLQKIEDYEIDEKAKSVLLTESGTDKVEKALNVENLYASENVLILHHVQQALRANTIFKKDVDYIVREDEVLIVDEFTGRILAGRRYSDGLHQALEAKEGVKVERENQTLATVTLQNFFRMYDKLAGMTGTAETEAAEFYKIYKLGVTVIPTHLPIARKDHQDAIYLSSEDKFDAVMEEILSCHKKGQPVLVGTISVEVSEYLSNLLNQKGIPHNVLNAKQHEREADIVKEAGEKGRITIATNMAGRGTDIKLGDGVREAGGLHIIGTERHESRRIDNQLRGRSGRQGDPGSSRFFLSLDDDLIRIFAGEKVKNLMKRFGMEKGECIEDPWVSKSIASAQEKVEKHNFDIRKHLLEYDDVMNRQRTVIYEYRREILEGAETIKRLIKELITDVVKGILATHLPKRRCSQEEVANVFHQLSLLLGIDVEEFNKRDFDRSSIAKFEEQINDFIGYVYDRYRESVNEEMIRAAEKWLLLETVDHAWKTHLQHLDHVREGIGLRGYGFKNPLVEYKKEAFDAFERMMEQIKWDMVQGIFKMKPSDASLEALSQIEEKRQRELDEIKMGNGDSTKSSQPVKRSQPKVGRNEPCPCGSGKKFKQCCGK